MSILTTIEVVIITILSLYPILGAMFWFWGAMAYVIFRRKDELKPDQKLDHEPFITIMVPAHNEEIVIESTLTFLLTKLNYHNYEVLVMDDGSTDKTPEIFPLNTKQAAVIHQQEHSHQNHGYQGT